VQPAARRHQPGHRGDRVRRLDHRRHRLARLSSVPAAARLGLLRTVVRLGGIPDRARTGLRGRSGQRHHLRPARRVRPARGGQPLPRSQRRRQPRPVPPDACRGVPRRLPRAAGADRHEPRKHAAAGSDHVPHPGQPPLPYRRRVVHLPHLRLGPRPERRPRGGHPLDLHLGVRQPPAALRLVPGAPAAALRQAQADRVRPARVHPHGHLQATAGGPGRRRGGGRVGRPPDAHPARAPAAGVPAGGDPGVLHRDRHHPHQQPAVDRGPGVVRAARAQRDRSAPDGGAAAAAPADHQLAGRGRWDAGHRVRRSGQQPGGPGRRRPAGGVQRRVVDRGRRLRRSAAAEVLPARTGTRGAAAWGLLRHLHRGDSRRRGPRGRGPGQLRPGDPGWGRPRRPQGEVHDALGVRPARRPCRGGAVRPAVHRRRPRRAHR